MKLLSSIFGLSERCLFTSFLKLLNVKHNKGFSDAYFYQHPYNGNLFGFSSMLQDYGVENVGLKLDDKEEITALQTPFIAQIADDFVIVSKVASGQVDYIWRGERIRSAWASFFETWTGVVLLAEADKDSGEPDFKKHYKEELFGRIRHYALGSVVLMFGLLAYIGNGTYSNLEFTLLLLANFGGLYISLLLVLKQMDIHSEYADKLCSLFNKNGCNNILETEAAKFMGVVSWSEVGLSYFLANSCILLFLPQYAGYLLLFNLCALPYSFWSVWYQKFRAKQWCMLCLLVQALLWSIAAIGFILAGIHTPPLGSADVLLAGGIYVFAYLGISLLLPAFTKAKQQEREVQQINSLKMKERVFSALLKEQPHYEVDRSTSQIVFGNPDAGLLITILSNPHCYPCAKMHKRVEKLLKACPDDLCVQYVFSSFGQEYQSSSVFLTAVYLNNTIEFVREVYNEWFTSGSMQKERFFTRYLQNTSDEKVREEVQRHQAWIEKTKLHVTPTILINGYHLPKEYKIEDIRYFKDADLFQ